MVNRPLFMSAVICTVAHATAVGMARPHPLYGLFLLTACATSLWNHGTTGAVARFADRAFMVASIPVTAFISPHPVTWLTLALLSVSYGAAKATGALAPHLAAHTLITALNLRILGIL